MQLAMTVFAVVLGVTVVFAVAGYLIDLSARHFEHSTPDQSREHKRNIE
jgi:hypothetical protein